MRRKTALIAILIGLACVSTRLVFLGVSFASSAKVLKPPRHEQARLGQPVIIEAAGRGQSAIHLADGRDLETDYAGAPDAEQLLSDNATQPLALASADMDGDGIADLVCGYRSARGGLLAIHRGNVDSIYPNSLEAKQRKAAGEFTGAPFISPATVYSLPEAAELLAAGDFDGDGHADLLTARRGGRALHLLKVSGGSLIEAQRVELGGAITAMAAETDIRTTSAPLIVVGIEDEDGAKAMVYRSGVSATNRSPEVFDLPAATICFAIGRLDGQCSTDVVVAAGHHLLVLHGHQTPASDDTQGKRSASEIDRREFSFNIASIALGEFGGYRQRAVALLADDGTLHLLTASSNESRQARELSSLETMSLETLASDLSPRAVRLARAKSSCRPGDDLIALDQANKQMHIFVGGPDTSSQTTQANSDASFDQPRPRLQRLATLPADAAPLAVLPMRLNIDALDDLVILRSERRQPAVLMTQAATTITVTTTATTGNGSLSAAIAQANASPGSVINFAIGSGPQVIAAPILRITAPMTIDGTSQPGYAGAPIIVVNGEAAVPSAGLVGILGGNCVVRGLVVNGYAGGIGVKIATGGGNIIEGNYIGTDTTGTVAVPNRDQGLDMQASSDNLVGGTTVAARNVISGNGQNGVTISEGATGNKVQGNFIGTNKDGTSALPNASGVVIVGSGNLIGGTDAGAGNKIAFNKTLGVWVSSGTGNSIRHNSIYDNGSKGINLGPNFVTPNDDCDADTGANNLQNYPVLVRATTNPGTTVIGGTLKGAADTTFLIEFFTNHSCDGTGFGEGESYLGSTSIRTDASCMAAIDVTLPGTFEGQYFTATATDPAGNTSEFSACVKSEGTSILITDASIDGKRLYVYGQGFDAGAVITINGADQATVALGSDKLLAKKGGKPKFIPPGSTVTLQVRNSDGRLSNEYRFYRPVE